MVNDGETSRSLARNRRITVTFVSSLATRVVSVLTGLAVVPLMLSHLGEERYGVWLTLNSFVAYLAFADLGLGNGLLNAVSGAHGKDDKNRSRQYISSTFFMLLVLAVGVASVFMAAFAWIPWASLLAAKTNRAATEAAPAVLVFLIIFVVQMPLNIVQRVNLGCQEGHINSMFQAVGSVLGLVAVFIVVRLQLGLPWIVLAYSGAPLFAVAVNWWVLFFLKHRELRPSLGGFRLSMAKSLLRVGGLFFVLQIAVAVAFASDSIVAAQFLGPEEVTRLGVPSRLFGLVLSVLSLAYIPLWPAYSEAIARGDVGWVNMTLAKSIKFTLIILVPSMVLMLFLSNPVMRLWVGDEVQPSSFLLLAGLATWTVLAAIGNAVSMLLNAANVVRFQVVTAILMALVAVGLKVIFAMKWGIEGIVWGTVIAYGFITLMPCIWYLRQKLPWHLSRIAKNAIADETL